VNWKVMAEITSSWVTSPLIGGMIAAGMLYLSRPSSSTARTRSRREALGAGPDRDHGRQLSPPT
jgi:phosphate/sulfate permease